MKYTSSLTRSLLLILLFGILNACNTKKDETPIGTCPGVDSPIYWEPYHLAYGDWPLGFSSNDGDFGIPTGGASVINLRTHCQWQYYGTETGGTGNTYAVYAFDTAVIFRWANHNFYQFVVSSKWKGIATGGVIMGDKLSTFLQKCPGFQINIDSTFYRLNLNNGMVLAWFTDRKPEVGKLYKLMVTTE